MVQQWQPLTMRRGGADDEATTKGLGEKRTEPLFCCLSDELRRKKRTEVRHS